MASVMEPSGSRKANERLESGPVSSQVGRSQRSCRMKCRFAHSGFHLTSLSSWPSVKNSFSAGSLVGTPLNVTLERPMEGTKTASGNGCISICDSFWISEKGIAPAKVRTKLDAVDQRPDNRIRWDLAALKLARICWVVARGSWWPSLSACGSLLHSRVTSVWEDAPDRLGDLFKSGPDGLEILAPFLLPVGLWLAGTGIQLFCGGVGVPVHEGVGGEQGLSARGTTGVFLGWGVRVFVVESLCSSWSIRSDIRLRRFSRLGSRVELLSDGSKVCV
jgi:hypothetical protein